MPPADGRRRLRPPAPPLLCAARRRGGWPRRRAPRWTPQRPRRPPGQGPARPTGARNTPTAPPGGQRRDRGSCRRNRRWLRPTDGPPAPHAPPEKSALRSWRRARRASLLMIPAGELVERVVEHIGEHAEAIAYPAG